MPRPWNNFQTYCIWPRCFSPVLPTAYSNITGWSLSLAPQFPCSWLLPSFPSSPPWLLSSAFSLPFLLSAWGTAHRHRSWLCRPSFRRHRHNGYSPPRSPLHLHMSHPPGHTLLGPEIRGNSLGWEWKRTSWLTFVHLTLFPEKTCFCLSFRRTISE